MFIRPFQTWNKLYRITYFSKNFRLIYANPGYATICGIGTHSNRPVLSIRKITTSNLNSSAIQQPSPNVENKNTNKLSIENVMNRLESYHQLNGFISVELIQPLEQILKSDYNNCLSPEQGLFLLNACGCEMPFSPIKERLSRVEYIWDHLQTLDVISKEHFLIMLQVLQYNRAPIKDYRRFLKEFERKEGSAKDILSDLLAVAGAAGSVRQTSEILTEMRSMQLPLTERDFNSILLAHARAKDITGFQAVMDSMHAARVEPSADTQKTLISAYLEMGNETKAQEILEKYHGEFQPHQIENILRRANESSNVSTEFVAQLAKELKPEYVLNPEVPKALRRVCVEFLQNKKIDYVMAVINTLPAPNFQENQDSDTFCTFLLHALFRFNCNLEDIIAIAEQLEESNKNKRALHIVAEIALRRSPPMVLSIFEAMVKHDYPLRPHYFWPLMMYNFRRHSEHGILRTLKIMQNFKVECDHQTIVEIVIPKLSIILTNPKLALKQMDEMGVKTSLVMKPIISHMLAQTSWFYAVSLLEAYPTKIAAVDLIPQLSSVAVNVRATKRYHQFAKLLSALSNKNTERKQDFIGQFLIDLLTTQSKISTDYAYLQRLTNEMKKNGLQLSTGAVSNIQSLLLKEDSMQDNNSNNKNLKLINQNFKEMTNHSLLLPNTSKNESTVSSFSNHPRDMSLDELECHLVELESKQMNTRGVLRRLLQLCVRDNRLERALEIKNKCDAMRVQISPGMLASIFDMYIKLKDVVNAEDSLHNLNTLFPGFNVDEHKFVDYAALLVEHGQIEKAIKLLEQRSLKQKIIGGDYILKNVWNFLTNIARHAATINNFPADRNLTRETQAKLQKLGYCRTQNAILGPIIRERLLRGDLSAAISEFKQLATQYKHTPLQFELLSLLVRVCNNSEDLRDKYKCSVEQAQQLLTEVTDIITRIHGVVNMNSGLLLAFAESGSDNQLRRLLLNPEFRINEELLLRNCEHLGQEGSVQTLLRLARGSRGLNRVINEQNIYNMLLNNYVKSNDCESALSLYQRLEGDDEMKISQDFYRTLVKLLKVNNIEIPSNIALRAKNV